MTYIIVIVFVPIKYLCLYLYTSASDEKDISLFYILSFVELNTNLIVIMIYKWVYNPDDGEESFKILPTCITILQYDINGITNCSSILKLLSEMFLYNMKPCHLKLPSI